jgi:hypothetical protein
MEATCSPETSVGFYWTTRRYIPEYRTLHNHLRGNLKSYSQKDASPYIKLIPSAGKLTDILFCSYFI